MISQTISHFKILEKIGEGGMGVVYLAEDTELHRKVALKFLPANYTADPELNARFKREARAAAALNHPNIITVYEVGEFEGKTYIAMEYVAGESLKARMGKETLSIEQVVDYTVQICAGLSKAHEAGIVHRDLKPENVMVDRDNRLRILDFGLAKLRDTTQLTRASSTLGTINYMSPEQFRSPDVDHRTDIWSLGVIVYEMLAGQLPFKADYEAAIMYSVMNEEPEPISSLKAEIPGQLELAVTKALCKNPDARYQAVGDLAADLRDLQTVVGTPSTKPPKKKALWVKKGLIGSWRIHAGAAWRISLVHLSIFVHSRADSKATRQGNCCFIF